MTSRGTSVIAPESSRGFMDNNRKLKREENHQEFVRFGLLRYKNGGGRMYLSNQGGAREGKSQQGLQGEGTLSRDPKKGESNQGHLTLLF